MSAFAAAGRKQLGYAVVVAVLLLGGIFLVNLSWRGTGELHTIMDLVGTLLAVNVGALALVRYHGPKDAKFLFLGSSFLGVSFLDGLHTVLTSSHVTVLLPAGPWTWLAPRLFLSITLFLGWIFLRLEQTRGLPRQPSDRWTYFILLGLTLVGCALLAIAPLPSGYYPGAIIPHPQELIPAAFFVLTLIGYLRTGTWRTDPFEHWLVISLIIGAGSQAAFASQSTQPLDAMFDTAHLLTIGSYICVLVGLLIDTYRMIHPSALAESRQLLDVIINSVGATIFWKDRNLIYMGCNAAFAQDAGFSRPEDVVGKDDYQMGWREQADLYRADDRQVIESGRSKLLIEEPQTTPDGRHITLLTNKVPLLGSDGKVIGLVGTYMDITKRKLTDEAVRQSEERYRALVESTSDWVWELDQNGLYTYVSPVVKSVTGYEPRDLVGKSPFDIMTPAEAQRVATTFASVVAARQSFSLLENTILHKNGQEIVLETSGVPIFDKDGGFRGYRGIDRNITEQKAVQRALQQRDALVRATADIAGTLVTASSVDDAISAALHSISQAIQVDRMVVMERPPGQRAPVLRYVWEGPRITAKLERSYFENSSVETAELIAWSAPLQRGDIIHADMKTATGDLKALLERFGVKKIMVVPVTVDGKYWGQIAFDTCDPDRTWAPFEGQILRTVAELLGTAIQRDRYIRELADANRIVQGTPTILYRMRGEPSLPMIYISQNAKLFGHDPAVLTASPLLYRSLIHPDDLETVIDGLTQALAGTAGVNEFRILTSKGEFRWVENHYMPLLDSTGRLVEVEGLLSDITERKAAEEKIAHLARTDSLTGLPNRGTFTERLRQFFAASRRGAPVFAVHYLDLDRFKDINDTLGHPVGDRLLVMIGERLQHCVRDTDLAARIGGDEFAILQTDLSDTADAGALADKLRAAIAGPIQIAGNELHITASVGIAVYAAETVKADDMLAQADVALYRAKEEGRDQYRFHTEELDVQVRDQVALAEELRQAIERDEFELYYQPQVELSTNQIVGMEALIRWNHPKRGLLLPGQFIELAERTGTILAIGQWVLDCACRQMSLWRAAGIAPQSIAVNVSSVQIKTATEFVDTVSTTLAKWHLAPPDLELDVTESTIARATLAQNDVLERLQKLGVRISIDDFGMKYSSLDYLKTYHVNRIKIPQPLIDAASRDQDSAAMTRAIIGIARELNIEVVAEGVESEMQWSFLATKSPVSKVQGYYYSKPVPAGDATSLLRQRRIEPQASTGAKTDSHAIRD